MTEEKPAIPEEEKAAPVGEDFFPPPGKKAGSGGKLDIGGEQPEPKGLRDYFFGPGAWIGWALVPALFALFFVSMQPIKRSAAAIAFPYQLDNEEAFILDQAMALASGRTIYGPITEYPFVVGNYPPVYPLLYSGLLTIFPPSLAVGRAIVMISVLIIAALLANMVAARTGRVIPALMAVVLFMATWDLNEWIAFARVDLTAIALGICGLAVICSRMKSFGLIIGAIMFAFAFFTKQTQVILPAAVFCAYLWKRDFARAGLFALLMSALILGGVAILTFLTNGQFWQHTVLYNINEMHLDSLRVWIRHIMAFGMWKLIALLPAIVLIAWIAGKPLAKRTNARNDYSPEELLLPIAIVFAALSFLSIYSIAKAGSAANYLLEFHVAAALLVGLAVGEAMRLLEVESNRNKRIALNVAGGIFVVLMTLHAWNNFLYRERYNAPPTPEFADFLAFVDIEAQSTNGQIFSEWPIFTIRAGQDVLLQPFIMSQLAREGKWDETPFLEDLRSRRFALLILAQDVRNEDQHFSSSTPAMRKAVRENYRFYREIAGYWLFVPRGSDREAPLPDVVEIMNEPGEYFDQLPNGLT